MCTFYKKVNIFCKHQLYTSLTRIKFTRTYISNKLKVVKLNTNSWMKMRVWRNHFPSFWTKTIAVGCIFWLALDFWHTKRFYLFPQVRFSNISYFPISITINTLREVCLSKSSNEQDLSSKVCKMLTKLKPIPWTCLHHHIRVKTGVY